MKDTITKFIKKIGKESEFKLFLDIIHNLPKMQFAVIKISGETLGNNLETIAEDIVFLNQLDVYPLVVHGAGSSLDKKLPNSKKVDGVRITNKEDMGVVKQVFCEAGNKLKQEIIMKGGSAQQLESVFGCKKIEKYGYVGEVSDVHLHKIEELVHSNVTPIITPLGQCNDEYLNINADTAAKALVKMVSPKKLIMLTETGGILDEQGEVIPFFNVCEEEHCHMTGGMLHKVKEIADFLKGYPDCEVTITSAEALLKEIFTIRGAGTFVKYHLIESTSDIASLDKGKIKYVLEDSFDKKLIQGYFDNGIKEVFYQKDYEGVGIIKIVNSIFYLDKFAVKKACQGTGLGKSIWNKIIKKYPALVWRASHDNEYNSFYFKECDGMIKKGGWYVYWKGLEQEKLLPTVEAVVNKERTIL